VNRVGKMIRSTLHLPLALFFTLLGAASAFAYFFFTSDHSLINSQRGFIPTWLISCFFWGGLKGHFVRRSKDTENLFEASLRAYLLFAGALCTAMVGTYLVEGVMLAFNGDPLGGGLKVLMALPYGPFIGILACLYSLWVLIPAAVIAALILFSRGPKGRIRPFS
jgi:hypothetical protein